MKARRAPLADLVTALRTSEVCRRLSNFRGFRRVLVQNVVSVTDVSACRAALCTSA